MAKKMVRIGVYIWGYQKTALDKQAKLTKKMENFGRASASSVLRSVIDEWMLELDKRAITGL